MRVKTWSNMVHILQTDCTLWLGSLVSLHHVGTNGSQSRKEKFLRPCTRRGHRTSSTTAWSHRESLRLRWDGQGQEYGCLSSIWRLCLLSPSFALQLVLPVRLRNPICRWLSAVALRKRAPCSTCRRTDLYDQVYCRCSVHGSLYLALTLPKTLAPDFIDTYCCLKKKNKKTKTHQQSRVFLFNRSFCNAPLVSVPM